MKALVIKYQITGKIMKIYCFCI